MRTKKIFIDFILLAFFIGALSSTFIAGDIHEIFGCVFIFFVVIHNLFNKNFYRSLGKGSSARKFNQISIILFGVSIILLTVSGFVIWDVLKLNSNLNWLSIHLGAAISSFSFMIIHLLLNAGRYVKGKKFLLATLLSIVLIAAGIFGLPYLDRWYHKVEVNRSEIISGEKVQLGGKILTVYFSRVGNTNFPQNVDAVSGASIMRDKEEIIGNAQMIALMAQDATGSDLLEIKTKKIYPASYSETTKVAQNEFADNELPALNVNINLKAYEKIILVYPLWWGTLPKPVESFIRSHDLNGKILIPIVTHGGGGIGDSVKVLQKISDAKVTEPLDIYSSDISASRQIISDFLDNLKP